MSAEKMKEINNSILFKNGGLKRPVNNTKGRILLKLNKISVIRDFKFIKKLFCRSFNLPQSTSFNRDFYCSSLNIFVGENVGLADTYILASAPVTIGNGCSFSYRNMLITSTHDINEFSTIIAKPIKIGNNVWITTNVTVLSGVSIGDNSIIGAGSVVTKNIPKGVFAAGNPCKVIREISFKK